MGACLALDCPPSKGGCYVAPHNTIDIIAGVGMFAIVLGALLFFFAANGTYRAAKWMYRMAS